MKCPSGKRSFFSENLAIEALIQVQIRSKVTPSGGAINVYECEDCSEWHLTSKGSSHPDLADPEIKRRISKERMAYEWEQRFR